MPEQAIFRAIADPTRRAIISMLAEQDMTLNEVVARFEMSRPAVAKHLGILEEGELITVRRKGRERINSLRPRTLKTVADWVNYFDRFWDEKLAALKEEVEKDHG